MDNEKSLQTMELSRLFTHFGVKPNLGLRSSDVPNLLTKYGSNEVKSSPRSHVIVEFFKNFTNPLVIILLVIAVTTFLMGEVTNSFIVLSMVIMSVSLNFYQEHKANLAAEKLQEKVALTTTVIRDGEERVVPAKSICLGDILILNAGDLIPADARVIVAKDFFVNQSSLTGESFPIEKYVEGTENTIFSGTNVITGTARALVIATGLKTEFGKISLSVISEEEDNSFTLGIKNFSFFILRIVVIFVLFIFAVNSLIKHDIFQSLAFAIAVTVGLTPEFLPMIMTVTMGKGALLMSKKGVIVKKLSAIPSLGSMNILCSDKTGTITEDKIRLVKYVDLYGKESLKVLLMAYINSSLQTGITNPLDQAVTDFHKFDISKYKKIDEIPFDFQRRCVSIIASDAKKKFMVTKGAPESLLTKSISILISGKVKPLTEDFKQSFIKEYEKLSTEGFRVLAIATKNVTNKKPTFSKNDESKLTILGLAAFLDPVKSNAKLAIEEMEKIGIEFKVVTGDNELVTKKICTDADIKIKGIILGTEISNMTDSELAQKAQNTTIFARFSPSDKERVIKCLKLSGSVVGYMGDGINDAPAIKEADVGISVDNGVDIAKESADFILTQKSLLVLRDGILEGRIIFGNTMKYILMSLSSNFGNMFSVLGGVLFLPFLPMLPIQILLNNFMYDLSQITIPTDTVDQEYLQVPRKWDVKFLQHFMFIFGPISSFFDFLTFYVLYSGFSHNSSAFQTGWFMESLATQILVIHIIRTQKVPFFKSKASLALILSTVSIVIIGWVLPYLPFSHLFSFTPLPRVTLIALACIVIAYLFVVEYGKKLFYKK